VARNVWNSERISKVFFLARVEENDWNISGRWWGRGEDGQGGRRGAFEGPEALNCKPEMVHECQEEIFDSPGGSTLVRLLYLRLGTEVRNLERAGFIEGVGPSKGKRFNEEGTRGTRSTTFSWSGASSAFLEVCLLLRGQKGCGG